MTCFKYGDDIDTDVIIAARYLHIPDIKELAKYTMLDIDPSFVEKVHPGDVIIAGSNFGSGSSREQAPMVLRECGIKCVIAKSYARIFFRNAINIGFPILTCPEAVDGIEVGDEILVDTTAGIIKNLTKNCEWTAEKLPEFIINIGEAGGLLAYLKGRK